MSPLADDQAALLRALERHAVEFVVIGGVAAQLHGWSAATNDLDIAISPGQSNADRLNRALASVGAGSPSYGQLGTAFETQYGRLEIVRRADGIGRYADWLKRASPHELEGGLIVIVADPEDILRSKSAARREKDLAAIRQMRRDFAAKRGQSS